MDGLSVAASIAGLISLVLEVGKAFHSLAHAADAVKDILDEVSRFSLPSVGSLPPAKGVIRSDV